MIKPTSKDYQALILGAICSDGYNVAEPTTDYEKIAFAYKTIHQELGWMLEQGQSLQNICDHWLRGLASACTIHFYNVDIIGWIESCTGEPVQEKHEEKQIEIYWITAARCLQMMLDRYARNYAKVTF